MVQQKNFWLFLILTIVTCGIYYYYFIYSTTKDLNQMAGDDGDRVDPVLAVILSLVTCGIYTIYWWYKMGNRIQKIGNVNGLNISENGTSYLLWILVGAIICGVGSYIGIYLFIKNFNIVAGTYNNSAY